MTDFGVGEERGNLLFPNLLCELNLLREKVLERDAGLNVLIGRVEILREIDIYKTIDKLLFSADGERVLFVRAVLR